MNFELILNLITNFLGVVAIILSTWAFIISTRNSTYSDLDNGYNEILKIGIEYPKFRNIKFTQNYKNTFDAEDIIRYENYAFMTMNFCETIFDKAKKDKRLFNTWLPAIINEYKIHKTWVNDPETEDLYKDEFKNYLKSINNN